MAEGLRQTATIASGTAISTMISSGGGFCFGLLMPAAWTAADLTFLVCDNPDGTFVDLYDDSASQVKVLSPGVARYISLVSITDALRPYSYIKLKSSVNQAADRVIGMVTRG